MHLFAGAGGGILSDILLGHQPVCAVEWNGYCQQVLSARQKDGSLPWFPIFGDVQQFDGKPWRGIVDVISGGFPCQDISSAGKGAGIEGTRSGLWREMARIIGEVRPRFVFVENSPLLVSRGLAVVISDLAALGYDARWMCLSAGECGANHERDRLWIVASNADCNSKSDCSVNDEAQGMQGVCAGDAAYSNMPQREGGRVSSGVHPQYAYPSDALWWKNKPDIHRVDDGVAARMDRLKAIGNGQVPRVAAAAFSILSNSGEGEQR